MLVESGVRALESRIELKYSEISLRNSIQNASSREKDWNPAPGIHNPRNEVQNLLFFLYLPSTHQKPTFSKKFEDFVNDISVRSFLPFTDCFFLSGVVSFRFHAPRDSPESKAIIVSQPDNKEVGTRFNINFESCNFSESKNIKCGSSDGSRGFSLPIKVKRE